MNTRAHVRTYARNHTDTHTHSTHARNHVHTQAHTESLQELQLVTNHTQDVKGILHLQVWQTETQRGRDTYKTEEERESLCVSKIFIPPSEVQAPNIAVFIFCFVFCFLFQLLLCFCFGSYLGSKQERCRELCPDSVGALGEIFCHQNHFTLQWSPAGYTKKSVWKMCKVW